MNPVQVRGEHCCYGSQYVGYQLEGNTTHEDVLSVTNNSGSPFRIATDVGSNGSTSDHLHNEL